MASENICFYNRVLIFFQITKSDLIVFTQIYFVAVCNSSLHVLQDIISQSLRAHSSRVSASRRVSDLLTGLYSPAYLATHSLTGITAGSGPVKSALDTDVVKAIIGKLSLSIQG